MFYFFLAEKLGRTVNELLKTISSKELTEWMIYYEWKNKEQEKSMKEAKKKTPNKPMRKPRRK